MCLKKLKLLFCGAVMSRMYSTFSAGVKYTGVVYRTSHSSTILCYKNRQISSRLRLKDKGFVPAMRAGVMGTC